MINILSRLMIKDYRNYKEPSVRRSYGMLCGAVGILWNLLLFAGKFTVGSLSGSIAITADAFNNLSDAGSSIITLFGFRLAGQKPDPEHPFGHGRLEYISGLVVSIAILIMGFELGKTSIDKIITPEPVDFSWVSALVLVAAILVKLYMMFYNFRVAKKIDSVAMRATAKDSMSDALSTLVVLIASMISLYTGIQIDGWCGVLVACFILFTGFSAIKDTIGPLLGQPPSPEFVKEIEDIVLSHPEVLGVHDLVVHNYGPGRIMISLHAEVSSDNCFIDIHDTIDNIERELVERTGSTAVIHMDPIVTNDEHLTQLKEQVINLARALDSTVTIHDFRIVAGPTHTNIIFDVVIPFGFRLTDDEVKKILSGQIRQLNDAYYPVIEVDKDYSSHNA